MDRDLHRRVPSGGGLGREVRAAQFPLIDLDLSRADCLRLLAEHGWESTPKSACLGCPFHGNAQWRQIRDESPEEWADVVEFDERIRAGNARANADGRPLLGQAYLHRSRQPLAIAPIDKLTRNELRALQQQAEVTEDELELGSEGGCSPFSCRGEAA